LRNTFPVRLAGPEETGQPPYGTLVNQVSPEPEGSILRTDLGLVNA